MSSIIQIKRSPNSTVPTLSQGELAYSADLSNYKNGKFYIGGLDANTSTIAIGGTYYTGLIDASASGILSTSSVNVNGSIPILSASGTIDQWLVGNTQLVGNTLKATNSNGNLILSGNGSGHVQIAGINSYTLPNTTGTSGYVLTTDGVNAATWQAVSSDLRIAGTSGTGDISLLTQTLTVTGSGAISTVASGQTVTVSVAAATSSSLGVASFDSSLFNVSAGAVTIKPNSITNSQLANNTIIINGHTGTLGSSVSIPIETSSPLKFNSTLDAFGIISGPNQFDGSAEVTIGINTATIMQHALFANEATSASVAFSLDAGSTSSIYVGHAALSDLATTATSAGTAYSLANTLTFSTGLNGGSFNGSTTATISLNTSTLMTTAVNAFTATNAAIAFSLNAGSTSTMYVGHAALADTATNAAIAFSLNAGSTSTMYVGHAALADLASTANVANSLANTLTFGQGLYSGSFNGSSSVTVALNTGTLMANAVNASNAVTATNAAFAFGLDAGSTSTMYVGHAALANLATTATSAGTAYLLANGLTIGSGLNGGSFNGGTTATITLNTSTLMQQAVTATNAAIAFGLNAGSTSSMYVGHAALADTATSAAFAFGLNAGSTSTMYVGHAALADTATSAAFAFGLNAGSTSSMYVGHAALSDLATSATTSLNWLGSNVPNPAVFNNSVTFGGPVTFSGTSTYVYSTNTVYSDNIIELHANNGNVSDNWTVDDGKDIGFRFHYFDTTDTNAAFVLANDTKYFEFYKSGADGATFAGEKYATLKMGNIVLDNSTLTNGITFADNTVQTTAWKGLVNAGSQTLGGNLETGNYSIRGGNYDGSSLSFPVGFGAVLQSVYDGNVFIKTGSAGSVSKTWTFDYTGAITFPDNSVQTTAWKGTTSTLVSGSYTVSLVNSKLTVPGDIVVTSGNISVSGVVTATTFIGNLTGNATNATLAQVANSLSNALTIGTGLSGTSFNGSTGVTISIPSTIAGNGTSYNSGVISVGGTANRITVNTNSVDIASTYIGQTSITTVGTITTGTWNGSTIDAAHGGTGWTAYDDGDLLVGHSAYGLGKLGKGAPGQVLMMDTATNFPVWAASIDGGTY